MGSRYTKNAYQASTGRTRPQIHFYVLRAQRTCLVTANVVSFLLNEIYKLKQMWLFLDVLYVTM